MIRKEEREGDDSFDRLADAIEKNVPRDQWEDHLKAIRQQKTTYPSGFSNLGSKTTTVDNSGCLLEAFHTLTHGIFRTTDERTTFYDPEIQKLIANARNKNDEISKSAKDRLRQLNLDHLI